MRPSSRPLRWRGWKSTETRSDTGPVRTTYYSDRKTLNTASADGCHWRLVRQCLAGQEHWQQAASGTQDIHHLSLRGVSGNSPYMRMGLVSDSGWSDSRLPVTRSGVSLVCGKAARAEARGSSGTHTSVRYSVAFSRNPGHRGAGRWCSPSRHLPATGMPGSSRCPPRTSVRVEMSARLPRG